MERHPTGEQKGWQTMGCGEGKQAPLFRIHIVKSQWVHLGYLTLNLLAIFIFPHNTKIAFLVFTGEYLVQFAHPLFHQVPPLFSCQMTGNSLAMRTMEYGYSQIVTNINIAYSCFLLIHIQPNLAKSSYGLFPLQLHHKFEQNKKVCNSHNHHCNALKNP